MTAAEDFDPYLLPLPTSASPIVVPHLASPLHAHLKGRYGDPVWPLGPLTGNPSTRKPSIYWEHWPAAFRDEMRLAAWNLINGQLRPTFLRGHSRRMRGRPAMTEVSGTLAQWRQLARWLEERGISSLAGCDAGTLTTTAGISATLARAGNASWCPCGADPAMGPGPAQRPP